MDLGLIESMSGPPKHRSVPDLICLSHLRWNFVFQRPQHLMTRCACERRVFFVEEPIFEPDIAPHLSIEPVRRSGSSDSSERRADSSERRADSSERRAGSLDPAETVDASSVLVVVPHLPADLSGDAIASALRRLIDGLIRRQHISEYLLWYYTPMALDFTDHLTPQAVIYDCMDELSAFKDAPATLKKREAELMRRAALVLTGGRSLYEAKRDQHHNIHAFPSSVDVEHFAQARTVADDPPDQAVIARPRLGFFGVIDERMDLELLAAVADARPDWQIVMLGPVAKIDPAALPRRSNIHYLGGKTYAELPRYLAGWDVALLPFARNEATRYISPTKTPEYLAAGKPVVSTSIRDVVRPYGDLGLVRIADDPSSFVRACLASMAEHAGRRRRLADVYLRQTSWDGTWSRIRRLMHDLRPGRSTDAAVIAGASATDAAAV